MNDAGSNNSQPTAYDLEMEKVEEIYRNAVGTANSARSNAVNAAARERDRGYDSAGILYERMKKYLPRQMKASGMGNMGIAQTALNDINNSHMNNRAAVTGQYNDAVSKANDSYLTAMGEANNTRLGTELQILGEQDSAVRDVMTNLDNFENRDAALAALGMLITADPNDERYATYASQINTHFDNKDAEDRRNAGVTEILSGIERGEYKEDVDVVGALLELYGGDQSSADYTNDRTKLMGAFEKYTAGAYDARIDYIDQLLMLYNDDPDKMNELLQGFIEEGGLKEENINLFNGMIEDARGEKADEAQATALSAFQDQLDLLANNVKTTDEEFQKLWDEYKPQLSESAQNVYERVIDYHMNDPRRNGQRQQNALDAIFLEEANQNGFYDLATYYNAVVSGNAQYYKYVVTDSEPLNMEDDETELLALAKYTAADTNVALWIGDEKKCFAHIDGKWYRAENVTED